MGNDLTNLLKEAIDLAEFWRRKCKALNELIEQECDKEVQKKAWKIIARKEEDGNW